MKQFMEPEVKLELFRVEDIITTSVSVEEPDPGDNGTPIVPLV